MLLRESGEYLNSEEVFFKCPISSLNIQFSTVLLSVCESCWLMQSEMSDV